MIDNNRDSQRAEFSGNRSASIGSRYACFYHQGIRPWGLGTRPERSPVGGSLRGTVVPLKWSFSIFSSIRKDGAGGVRGRPERPLRRDLAGPIDQKPRNGKFHILRPRPEPPPTGSIDHILVKPAASNIPAPPAQGENSQLGEAESFKL